MSVHYKFKSALEYDTVTFDGLHISVKDLKNAIIQQKRIGKNTDFDLQVTNAQTKEVYEDEDALIPKNTSLLIARIPLATQTKSKSWDGYGGDATPPNRADEGGPIAKAVDLANLDVSEDDKIRAMMSQSTQDYDPSNYMKIRGANQMGAVPPNYRCYKCHQSGHWIKDCPLSQGPEPMEIKKSTGIPRSFMVPVEGPQVPGAMMTPNGSYAVPVLDHQAYTQKQPVPPPVQEEKPEIPEDLLCSICSDLLTDAVMIPCCGMSFCDECIRSCLLESEEHECPDCHEKDISPGTLIPNRYLRNSVSNFKNNTGYVKRPVYKSTATIEEPQTKLASDKEKKPLSPQPVPKEEAPNQLSKVESIEKTIISEADSTEPLKKTIVDSSEDTDVSESSKGKQAGIPEGPPGVSPRESPKAQPITNMANMPRQHTLGPRHSQKHSGRDRSPRRFSRRSPNYPEPHHRVEDRPGTPTIDEPGVGSAVVSNGRGYPPTSGGYNNGPPGVIPPIMGGLPQPSVMQGPPPVTGPYSQRQPPPGVFPPSQGPPPNYRLPPPPNQYMPPGPYNAPPRPVFDTSRPPGPIPSYPPGYPPHSSHRSSRGRDYPPIPRSARGRTPPRIIDDPLEAFNRMLREKDERERRAKQRKGRSYSRSSSRSFSRSPRRVRSRSPRRRGSRSRSRSFSMSRSRSRSFSAVRDKGSPYREFSPRNSPRRRAHSRFRSPIRSPPRYRYKEPQQADRVRDRDHDRERVDREYPRDKRGHSREREFRDRDVRERDTREAADYRYYENYDRDRGNRNKPQWGPGGPRGPPDSYYPPEMHPQVPPYGQPNRYSSREQYVPPHIPQVQHVPPPHHPPSMSRRYEDVVPPGTEQPPVPGMEPSPRFDDRYQYDKQQELEKEHEEKKERRHRHSHTPEKQTSSPKKTRDRHETPERHSKRKKRDDSSDRENKREPDRDRHRRDVSDDEKSKKSKDRKRRKEKKEAERKKRKEKKEKRERKAEEKKVKEVKKAKEKEEVEEEPEVKVKEPKEVKKEDKPVKKEPKPKEKSPVVEELPEIPEEPKPDLYGDILTEGIDSKVVENYGKIEEIQAEAKEEEIEKEVKQEDEESEREEGETSKEYEDSEKDILELHTNEAELKLEKSEILAPLPEKSKWEMDEEVAQTPTTPTDASKSDSKPEKHAKVTNEVLKRAENAIFAKAINAIRPIEIKKISTDRAKLYSGERGDRKSDEMPEVVTIGSEYEEDLLPPGTEPKIVEIPPERPRLSVKERLGCKVDDLDRIVKVDRGYDRNRSSSLSPLSKRGADVGRNYSQGERRIELEERRRHERRSRSRHGDRDRHSRTYRSLTERFESRREHRDRREEHHRRDNYRESHRREQISKKDDRKSGRDTTPPIKSSRTSREELAKKDKRKRSASNESHDRRSEKDKKKRKEKKQKKEKSKKHHKKEEDDKEKESDVKEEKQEDSVKPKSATDRRKPTLDEANFEPDYDLETESEKEEEKKAHKRDASTSSESDFEKKKKDSSSSVSSSSSSDEDRKKKKHKKHRKKKSKRETSSSSSDSDSDSSEDEKERKRRKHKKKQRKRKKSKHK